MKVYYRLPGNRLRDSFGPWHNACIEPGRPWCKGPCACLPDSEWRRCPNITELLLCWPSKFRHSSHSKSGWCPSCWRQTHAPHRRWRVRTSGRIWLTYCSGNWSLGVYLTISFTFLKISWLLRLVSMRQLALASIIRFLPKE